MRVRSFIIVLLFSILICAASSAELEIHFLNVGQADCTIVLCDGESMVVDGGTPVASQFVYSYLHEALGLSSVRWVVATHPHEDHVGGLPAVLNAVQVDAIMSPVPAWDLESFNFMLMYAEMQGAPVFVPQEGDVYALGGADIEILSCSPESAWSVNDMSIVLRITYGDVSVILPGDAEWMTEYALLTMYPDLHADVLKAGHHGSNSSSTLEFVAAVAPKYAVISCGAGNTYNHPNREVLDTFYEEGCTIFRTDLQGTIIMRSDGNAINWKTERTASTEELFLAPGDVRMAEIRTLVEEDDAVAYIGNVKKHRFHYPWCSSVMSMNPANQITFTSREEAIEQGYVPCGNCKP